MKYSVDVRKTKREESDYFKVQHMMANKNELHSSQALLQ